MTEISRILDRERGREREGGREREIERPTSKARADPACV